MKTQIRNAFVYLSDFKFHKGHLTLEGERILRFGTAKEEVDEIINADGTYVIPGLIDIHFHGCNGADLCDGTQESIKKMVQYERINGITTICPSTMTLPVKQLMKIANAVKTFRRNNPDELAGFHLEGPFINSQKGGAQEIKACQKPDVTLFHQIQEASGNAIKHVTIAPELEGAEEFIRKVSKNTRVSIGHSKANYKQALESFHAGASQVTHLYNAMETWSHREPGIPGACLDAKDVFIELICDGNHLHPSVIRSAWKQFGSDRIVLISDSTMATGLPDGEYTLGGTKVYCNAKRVTTKDEVLAGSASNLMDCLTYVHKSVQISLEEAVKCATINPAKILNLDEDYGSLNNGKYANIVILGSDMRLQGVIYKGMILK